MNTVITTKTYEQINEIYNKTRTITQKYQTQIKHTLYNDYTHEITNTQTYNRKVILIHKTTVQAMR